MFTYNNKSWLEKYNLLKKVFEENGLNYIPIYYCVGDVQLGKWCAKQRSIYRKGKMPEERIKLLKDINFLFEIRSGNNTSIPEQLLVYYLKKIFDNVSNRDKSYGFELDCYFEYAGKKIAIEYCGLWHNDRVDNDIEKIDKCAKNKIILFSIRDWNCSSIYANSEYYKEYILTHNFFKDRDYSEYEAVINNIFKEIGEILGIDINCDININRDIRNVLHNYSNFIKLSWKEKYDELKKYYENTGNNFVPYSNYDLWKWCDHQKRQKRSGVLSDEKIRLLDEINFTWNVYADWDSRFELLKDYYEQYKTVNINKNVVFDDFNVGRWVDTQRNYYKNNKLSKEQIEKLEGLGIIWNMETYEWEQKYNKILDYYNQYGYLTVPKDDENYKSLKKFIYRQRDFYKQGKLSDERIEKLKKINIL